MSKPAAPRRGRRIPASTTCAVPTRPVSRHSCSRRALRRRRSDRAHVPSCPWSPAATTTSASSSSSTFRRAQHSERPTTDGLPLGDSARAERASPAFCIRIRRASPYPRAPCSGWTPSSGRSASTMLAISSSFISATRRRTAAATPDARRALARCPTFSAPSTLGRARGTTTPPIDPPPRCRDTSRMGSTPSPCLRRC